MSHDSDILDEATRLAVSFTETTLTRDDEADEAALLARLNAGNGDEEPSVGDEVGHEARARLSVYQEITDLLVARGVPREEIAWIHDAKTPSEREALFARTRSGEVRIIIGSTFRMGVGVNIQERCYAVHHITTPWRPCDVKQADGRIWRPGNLFPEVWVCRYIAAPSFDGFSWQGIETKGKFEDAYLRGDPTVRTMSDIDEQIISAGEIKALASGDPRIVQKVRLEHELNRLRQQRDGWDGTRRNARMGVVRADGEAEEIRQRADWHRQYLGQRTEQRTLVILDTTHDIIDPAQHRAVGKAVREQIMDWASSTDVANQLRMRSSAAACVGSYRGLPLWAMIELDYGGKKKLPYLMLADEREEQRRGYVEYTSTTLTRLSAFTIYIGDTKEVLPRMESAANDLDDRIAGLAAEEVATQVAAAKLRAQLEEPWEHARTFRMMELGLRYLDAVLNENQKATEAVIAEVLALAESEGLDIDAIIREGEALQEQGVDLSTIKVTLPPLPQAAAVRVAPAQDALPAAWFAPAAPVLAPSAAAEAPRLDTERTAEPGNFISISLFANPLPIARPTLEVATLDLKDMATEAARKKAELANRKRKAQTDAGQASFFG